jgi:hypothetical protein
MLVDAVRLERRDSGRWQRPEAPLDEQLAAILHGLVAQGDFRAEKAALIKAS